MYMYIYIYADEFLKKDLEVVKLAVQQSVKGVENALQFAKEGNDSGFTPTSRWAPALLVLYIFV